MPRPLRQRLANDACLVLSPHLDDAVLSCAALLGAAADTSSPAAPHHTARPKRAPQHVVATVFTEAGPGPWPPLGRRIAGAAGHADPHRSLAARREEDLTALGGLGVHVQHLGFTEAPYRRAGDRRHGRWLYPTFRYDALRGRVSRADRGLAARLRGALEQLFARERASVVLAPLGIGRHVDHLLVRDAAASAERPPGCALVYYSDFPYWSRAAPDARFVAEHGLVPLDRCRDPALTAAMIDGYPSQRSVLFPDGRIADLPDRYWLPASDAALR